MPTPTQTQTQKGKYSDADIAPPADAAPAAQQEAPPSLSSRMMSSAGDFVTGIGKGALSTISGTDDWAAKHLPAWFTTPIGQAATPENSARAVAATKQMATPNNTVQRIGSGVEQAAEFLLPGPAEEKAAGYLGAGLSKLPGLAKAAPTLAKIGTSAVGSGLVNKMQGGTFGGGAAAGVVGAGIGAGLKKIAPVVAETALKVRGTDRAFGATPGRAILDETKGFSPRAVVDSARESLTRLHDMHAAELTDAPGHVSLTPARDIGASYASKTLEENHPETIKRIGNLVSQLDTDYGSKAEIPESVSPSRAAALNRGLSDAKTSWNPVTANDTMNAAAGMMHHELGNSIAEVVPSIKPLNQRIQSLIPVVKRGTAEDLNAGLLQRIIGRFGTPTGALLGGAAGFHFAGVPGAMAGLAGPELLSNPTTLMAGARAANSPAMRKIALPLFRGAGLNVFGRPDDPQ